MQTSVRRSLAAVAVAPLLALTLVACGDDAGDGDSDDNPTQTVETATEDAEVEGGPETDATPQTDGPSTGESDDGTDPTPDLPSGQAVDLDQFAEIVRDGMERVTTASVDVLVDIDGEGGDGTGVLDVTGNRDALELNLADQGSEERAAFYMIDGVVFLKEDATSDDKFIKLQPDLNEGLSLYSLFHPHQLTDIFLDEAKSVEHLGAEEADGESVEHYRMDVDPKAFDKILGGLLPPSASPTVIEQQIWLDADGRLVRSLVELAEGEEEFIIEMSLGDFGGPAPVEEPPASEVEDLSEFRGE